MSKEDFDIHISEEGRVFIQFLLKQCERYQRALERYADKGNWIAIKGDFAGHEVAQIFGPTKDGWKIAEEALKGDDE